MGNHDLRATQCDLWSRLLFQKKQRHHGPDSIPNHKDVGRDLDLLFKKRVTWVHAST